MKTPEPAAQSFGSVKSSEVKGKKSGSETLVAAVLIFLLGITMILGHVKVYEKRLELEDKYDYLSELHMQLGEKRKARTEEQAGEGMYVPQPEDYIIVYVRETAEP